MVPKDARSTFPIIDDQGCPVDPSIFPRFTPEGNALLSVYEAFRFTESYGVIFQCNVKYCLGPCQPVSFCLWGNLRGNCRYDKFFIALKKERQEPVVQGISKILNIKSLCKYEITKKLFYQKKKDFISNSIAILNHFVTL